MQSAIGLLQVVVDEMNLAGFTNIDRYVAGLEAHLEVILLQRLSTTMEGWVAAFKVTEQAHQHRRTMTMKQATPEKKVRILPPCSRPH